MTQQSKPLKAVIVENKELIEFQTWLKAHVTTNEGSLKEYSYTARALIDYLQGKPLEDITEKDINGFIVHLKGKLKTNSLINRMASLRHLMRYLKKDINIPIPTSIETRTSDDCLTEQEIQQLFIATASKPRDNAIIKTLYFTDLRKGELQNLNVEDIDFTKKTVIVRNGKGMKGSPQTISISDTALESIKAYLKVRGIPKPGYEQALFLNIDRRRLTESGVDHVVKCAVSKTNIQKHVYPHMFRASLITHMANNGASILVIQQQSRHKSLATLKRYVRPTQEEKLKNYQNYVPKITETEVTKKEPEQPQPPKKPDDVMVGSTDETTQLKLRLLQIEEEKIKLKLANQEQGKVAIYQ